MNTRLHRWAAWFALICLLLHLTTAVSFAQNSRTDAREATDPITGILRWQKDGTPLVTAYGDQREPQVVSDGSGGAVIIWRDFRPHLTNNGSGNLYAQRISGAGSVLWDLDGVAITAEGGVADPQAVSDGQGGAIVAWWDTRDGRRRAFAQRVASNGTPLWTINGTPLSATNEQVHVRLTSDRTGGAFLVWIDYSETAASIVKAQHLGPDGSPAWAEGGMTISKWAREMVDPQAIDDGEGGVIVAWNGDCSNGWKGVCVQRLRADGTRAWGDDGVILSASSEAYPQVQLLADDVGGAYFIWVDRRNLTDDIYAQHLDSGGKAYWANGGVPVTVAEGDQKLPRMISDNHGGIIIAWYDTRFFYEPRNVFLQRIKGDGQAAWGAFGLLVGRQRMNSTYEGDRHFDLAIDGAGGAMLTWNGLVTVGSDQIDGILVQRISSNGITLWPGQGAIAQIDKQGYGVGAPRLLPVGKADAIVVWEDNRRWYKKDEYDIYAQRVTEGVYHSYLPRIGS